MDNDGALRAPRRVATDPLQVGTAASGLGDEGLNERSRAPKTCPHRTAAEIEEQVVLLKKANGWGARKLHRLLRKQLDTSEVPCRSTVFDIFRRHGLVKHRRRRQRWQHPGGAPLHTDGPNEVWTIDFKGQFKTRDGIYCYPLTVLDNYSRYLLACTGLHDVKTRGTKRALERAICFSIVGAACAVPSTPSTSGQRPGQFDPRSDPS